MHTLIYFLLFPWLHKKNLQTQSSQSTTTTTTDHTVANKWITNTSKCLLMILMIKKGERNKKVCVSMQCKIIFVYVKYESCCFLPVRASA